MADQTENPQNIWQFLLVCFSWIGGRFTRILGALQGIFALAATQDNLVPPKLVPMIMFASAVLVFLRGQATAKVYANAQAIVKQATTPDVVLPDPQPSEPKK